MTTWIKTAERKPAEDLVVIFKTSQPAGNTSWTESAPVLMWIERPGVPGYVTMGKFRNGEPCPEGSNGTWERYVPMWAEITPPGVV